MYWLSYKSTFKWGSGFSTTLVCVPLHKTKLSARLTPWQKRHTWAAPTADPLHWAPTKEPEGVCIWFGIPKWLSSVVRTALGTTGWAKLTALKPSTSLQSPCAHKQQPAWEAITAITMSQYPRLRRCRVACTALPPQHMLECPPIHPRDGRSADADRDSAGMTQTLCVHAEVSIIVTFIQNVWFL